ncbi:g6051 [Coccomyxa elongata]
MMQAAALPKGSMDRLLLVAAFAQIGFSAGLRPYKCLNPVMGETFEVVRPEKNMRAVIEAVHQDFRGTTHIINAWHAEGARWELTGEDEPRVRFWGSSVDIHLNWTDVLTFDDGDTYSWRKGTSNISGLISGNLVITHKGILSITGHTSGATVHLTFKEPGMFSSKKAIKHEMTGVVEVDGKKLAAPTISGQFDQKLVATLEDGSHQVLWEKRYPPGGLGRCQFSEWTAHLNDIPQGLRKRLPPTDSRLRPDLRALDDGCYDKAAELKRELTGRMRARTLEAAKSGAPLQPRWFALADAAALTANVTAGTQQRYRFTGEYWQARRSGTWEHVPDLFNV